MKFGQLLSVVLIAGIVGIATNVGYEYFTTEKPHPDQKKFKEFLDKNWQDSLEKSPLFASLLGDKRYDEKVSSNSIEDFFIEKEYESYVLDVLSQIDPNNLSEEDQLNYRLLKSDYEISLEGREYPGYYMRLNQRGGVQDYYLYGNRLNFTDLQSYKNWFERVKGYTQNVRNSLEINKEGLELGYTQPKLVTRGVSAQIGAMLEKDLEDHPYFKIFKNVGDVASSEDALALQNEVKEYIQNVLNPTYQELYDFLVNEYLPESRDTIGISDVPNGKDWYEYLARYHTTTNLTPDEIHEIGLREVAKIRAEMEDIIEQVGWEGDFNSFLQYLRTDPRFYYETGEELLQAYRAMSKEIDAYMPTLFNKLPRAPYGVIPIPMESAPFTTTAYYNAPSKGRPGYYYANLYMPEVRPKYEIPVLSVHEAVPGHHHQISLAQEMENVPNFRKYLSITAFVEGWGLYSEQLGESMGIYDDPYDKFGQLTYDMWRAVRLVVDTGMHYKNWSREDAVNLFLENTAKTEQDINNEVDRYIAWPGQALAYKIGQLKIMELRDKSKEALGDDFDIKDFHDHILSFGSIPLNILEEKVDEFIEAKSK
jgi:prolyl oligopeptidase|tara:strand:- start:206 stop:1984 length:1779 start_codon:yes stop_codon:yes gene_type:complete